jgi:hypothetical protein
MRELFSLSRLQIEAPFRESDLFNTRNAILVRTEEALALDRIPLSEVKPFEWGFLLRPKRSARFLSWWKGLGSSEHHLWLESAELDHFGTQLFFPSLSSNWPPLIPSIALSTAPWAPMPPSVPGATPRGQANTSGVNASDRFCSPPMGLTS